MEECDHHARTLTGEATRERPRRVRRLLHGDRAEAQDCVHAPHPRGHLTLDPSPHWLQIGNTRTLSVDGTPVRVVVRPHDYTNGNYLRVVSNDGRLVLVLETDGTRVTKIRSGTASAADYTKGCA